MYFVCTWVNGIARVLIIPWLISEARVLTSEEPGVVASGAEYGGAVVQGAPIPQSTQGRSPTSVGGVVPGVEN